MVPIPNPVCPKRGRGMVDRIFESAFTAPSLFPPRHQISKMLYHDKIISSTCGGGESIKKKNANVSNLRY